MKIRSLLLGVTSLVIAAAVGAQTVATPAGSNYSGASAVVGIQPVDLSAYATNTYVNSVANVANSAYEYGTTAYNTANSAYWYGTTAYTNANNAYNLANTANNTANSAYWYGSTVYNNGRVVANAQAMVMGDGGHQLMPGICVSGFPQHNPWAPRGHGHGDPCPEGSGFLQTQFPTFTPA